jgi:hypothetical protein
MHVSYPYSRAIRLSVYNASYSGYFETRVGPNQEADLIRQLREAGFTVDPYDLEEAISIAS